MAETAQPFVCGGAAAMLASSVIHPMDLAKVRLQLIGQGTTAKRPGAFTMLRSMVVADGISSIYAGLSASLTRQATYGTARIGLHTTFSNMLVEANQGQPIAFWQKAGASMAGGGIAVCIGTPFDVALVRMQGDSLRPLAERRNYKNVIDALSRVAKEEGVTSLWRGLAPNILRGMSMNAGMMAFYDQAKESVISYVTHDPNPAMPSLPTQMLSALTAGFMCAFLSLPFDLMKSRLQDMAVGADGKAAYSGVVDCATKTFKSEGLFAFWRGFGAYYGRCAPHAMVILLTREQIIKQYRNVWGLDDHKNGKI